MRCFAIEVHLLLSLSYWMIAIRVVQSQSAFIYKALDCFFFNAFPASLPITIEREYAVISYISSILHKPFKFSQRWLIGFRAFWSSIVDCVHNCQLFNKEALANFNGLSQDGGQANLLKISMPLLFIKTNRMKSLSARARICRPFKEPRNRFPALRAGTTALFDISISVH